MKRKTIESQIVDTTVVVDGSSGEVLHEETHTQTAYKTIRPCNKKYSILFDDGLKYIIGLPRSQRDLIVLLIPLMEYADKKQPLSVTLNSTVKQGLCEQLGLTDIRSFNNILSQLVKQKILRRIGDGIYQFNPYLCAKGELDTIEKVCETWDDYLDSTNDAQS